MIVYRIKLCLSMFWKSLKAMIEAVYGAWKFSRLPKPIVTIFGGKSISMDCPATQKASELARRLVKNNISIISGGGPGVMCAASCGALKGLEEMEKKEFRSLGITVKNLDTEFERKCVQELISLNFFCTRKWFLMNYSKAFLIFEGGVGTIDELFEVANLMKTKQIPLAPIILIDKKFWEPINNWYKEIVKSKLVSKEYEDIFFLTDSLDEAMQIILKACK